MGPRTWLAAALLAIVVVGGCAAQATLRPGFRLQPAQPASAQELEGAREVVASRLAVIRPNAEVVVDNGALLVQIPPAEVTPAIVGTLTVPGQLSIVAVPDGATPPAEGVPFAGAPVVGNNAIAGASVGAAANGGRTVDLVLADAAAQAFGEYTKTHIGGYMAILLDGVALMAPVIRSEIPNGQIQIETGATGGFSLEDAQRVAAIAQSGPLPIALREASP